MPSNHIKAMLKKKIPNRDLRHGVAAVPIREPDQPKRSLNPVRRQHLEHIRNREMLKEKKEKVAAVLVRKLVIKFGSTHKILIAAMVSEFLATDKEITSETLSDLENDISTALKLLIGNRASAEAKSAADTGLEQKPPESKVSFDPARPRPPTGSEWEILQAYQSVVNEQKVKEDRDAVRNKNLKFKQALDQQIKAAKEVEAEKKKREEDYASRVNQDVEKFRSEQEAKKLELKRRYADEMLMRKQQIEEQQRLRDAERAALRRAEEDSLQRAREKILQDQERIASQKKQEGDMRLIIEKYNEENNKKKAEQKIEEMKEDNRLMREYAERLIKEEYERDNAFQKRMEQMDKFASKFATEGAGKVEREDRARQEQLLLKELQRKEAADLMKEKKKEEDQRLRIQQAIEENERQLEKRRQLQEADRIEVEHIAKKYAADGEQHRKAVQDARRLKKEKQLEYRSHLHSQMKERSGADTKLTTMADREKSYNMSELRKVAENPDVLKKVIERVRVDPSSPAAKSGGAKLKGDARPNNIF